MAGAYLAGPGVRRFLAGTILGAILAEGCAAPSPSPTAADAPDLAVLDLQVRNSGLRGGYLWLSMADQPQTGRWHQFGSAEFVCVTCPNAFRGIGSGYEIAVFDEACDLHGHFRTLGGRLQVAIDLGPTITLVPAPPLGDWMPADSLPAEPGTVPCSPP